MLVARQITNVQKWCDVRKKKKHVQTPDLFFFPFWRFFFFFSPKSRHQTQFYSYIFACATHATYDIYSFLCIFNYDCLYFILLLVNNVYIISDIAYTFFNKNTIWYIKYTIMYTLLYNKSCAKFFHAYGQYYNIFTFKLLCFFPPKSFFPINRFSTFVFFRQIGGKKKTNFFFPFRLFTFSDVGQRVSRAGKQSDDLWGQGRPQITILPTPGRDQWCTW